MHNQHLFFSEFIAMLLCTYLFMHIESGDIPSSDILALITPLANNLHTKAYEEDIMCIYFTQWQRLI